MTQRTSLWTRLPAGTSLLVVATAWALLPLANLPSFDAVKLAVLVPAAAILSFFAARRRKPGECDEALRDPLLLIPFVVAIAAAGAAAAAWPRGSLQGPALAIAAVAVARLVPTGPDGVRSTFRAVAVAAAGAGLYGLAQRAGLDPAPWGDRREVVATFGNTSFAAEFQAAALPMALALACGVAGRGDRVLGVTAAALAATHLVLAQSRIDLVAVVAGSVAFAFVALGNRRVAKALAATGALGAIAAAALFVAASQGVVTWLGRSDTLSVRVHVWDATLRLIADAPFRFGTAPFVDLYPPYRHAEEYRISLGRVVDTPHSDLLEIAATLGSIGVAAALTFSVLLVRRVSVLRTSARWESAAFAGTLVSLFVSGLASSPLSHPATALLLAVVAGHVVALSPRPAAFGWLRARPTDFGFVCVLAAAIVPGPALRTLRGDGFFALAMQYRTDARSADAVRLFDAACASDPQNFDARYELGTLLFRLGRGAESVAALRSAHEIRPNDSECRTNLVHALRAAGSAAEADALLDASLAQVPWHPLLRTARATRFAAAGDPAAALADLDAAVKLRPWDLRIRAVRADAALAASPGEASQTAALDLLTACRAANETDLMRKAARAFAARDPLFLAVLSARARRLVATDAPEAVALVLAPIEGLSPDDSGFFAEAARVLQQAGHAEESKRLLGRSLGLRARSAYRAGDTPGALQMAKQAADRDPIPEHRVLEALCLARSGELRAVREALAAAAALGPIDAAQVRADPAFARLLPDADLEAILTRAQSAAVPSQSAK
ncbi:MAG: O-antigen ligase family protein [Planctomycetes bacterium]|nr:O-antigen ligase family protein [Planctomycetota bacterium]